MTTPRLAGPSRYRDQRARAEPLVVAGLRWGLGHLGDLSNVPRQVLLDRVFRRRIRLFVEGDLFIVRLGHDRRLPAWPAANSRRRVKATCKDGPKAARKKAAKVNRLAIVCRKGKVVTTAWALGG